jgi:hypothetical protein
VKEKVPERLKNIRQIPFRLHMNDKILFMKLLSDADLTYQSFSQACMEAFLRADPAVMKVIKDWRDLSTVPKDHLERYTLSHRERDAIQKELEQMGGEQDVDPRNSR